MNYNEITELFLATTYWTSEDLFLASLKQYSKDTNCLYNKKDSKANKNLDSYWRFPFKFMHYRCIHGGKLRENKVDETRPKQSTIKLDCPVNWKMSKRGRKGLPE